MSYKFTVPKGKYQINMRLLMSDEWKKRMSNKHQPDYSNGILVSEDEVNDSIDELLKQLYSIGDEPEDLEDPRCPHEWATYQGITETYEYCKKCNLKKE